MSRAMDWQLTGPSTALNVFYHFGGPTIHTQWSHEVLLIDELQEANNRVSCIALMVWYVGNMAIMSLNEKKLDIGLRC
jgi:hypothetical protein